MNICRVKVYLDNVASKIPYYQHMQDAGADVYSINDVTINPGEIKLIHTGIYMELPVGYECQVRPRSGLALNNGITVLNSPGTIDSTFRGECNIILINHGSEVFYIHKDMKIAQFVFAQHCTASFTAVPSLEELSTTDRGESGFGSSGV